MVNSPAATTVPKPSPGVPARAGRGPSEPRIAKQISGHAIPRHNFREAADGQCCLGTEDLVDRLSRLFAPAASGSTKTIPSGALRR